ncbi:16S rRNA (cytosine(1402)-N(4))-methyltransferase RsmH [candidate division WWE3 bacterium]|uniref:Ribosomal RNA small subunit methyltransferase H n=1 Tax=candidate division WWE3 bacterium TaxID=2053526 RepID=A0A7X9HTL0_UNCKA|nr:16S rRNA (cytosine(1402)-N(4))-methyltransferase RsmH [candidate division WWE3 bacterium]
MIYHTPVLLKEALENLRVKKGGKYIDATLGDAGHTIEILKKGGSVLGIEINEGALVRARKRIEEENLSQNFIGILGNFKNIEEIANDNDFNEVSGVLYDLGYSSFELDYGGFGLSFQKDEPLDMRLDKSLGVTAEDLINSLSEKELSNLIFNYSDERMARKFARAIVKARNLKKIQTTLQLAEVIKSVSSPGYERGRIHPATRTFQALRIAVNDEITNLEKSLPRAAHLLLPGSVIVLITFHSLEDKVAKDFGRSARSSVKEIFEKPITASYEELEANTKSRSAKLRVFEKIK